MIKGEFTSSKNRKAVLSPSLSVEIHRCPRTFVSLSDLSTQYQKSTKDSVVYDIDASFAVRVVVIVDFDDFGDRSIGSFYDSVHVAIVVVTVVTICYLIGAYCYFGCI